MMLLTKAHRIDREVLASSSRLTNKRGLWWHDRGLLKLNFLIVIPLMSEYVQGYDASLINNVQQLKIWQKEFHYPKGSLLGNLSASYWVGNVLGVFFITPLSDRFGRRIAMFFGSLVAILGTALCTGAINAGMFIVGRILLGIGGVVVGAIGPVLVAELAYPGTFRLRSTWSWRIPSVFQALPPIAQALGIFLLPEPPRWLVSKGREDAALDVLSQYHANGNWEDEVVQFEYREIVGTIELEIAAKQTRWSELWRGRGNQWRMFIMIFFGICKQWSGNGVVSYYLHTMLNDVGITTAFQQTLITATSQMFSFACSVGFAFLPARVGRRPLLLWSMGLMWLVFTIITILTGVFTHTKYKPPPMPLSLSSILQVCTGQISFGKNGTQESTTRSQAGKDFGLVSSLNGSLFFQRIGETTPSVGSINGMLVKEYIQALTDENLIRVEKIGSGNWYWSFTSDAKKSKENSINKLKQEETKLFASMADAEQQIENEMTKRQEDDEMLLDGGSDRQDLTEAYEALVKENDALDKGLALYSDNDPAEIFRKIEETNKLRESTSRWTDNLESLESFLVTLTGDRAQAGDIMLQACGDDYILGEGLKELVVPN
ncbi:hypothetical protein DID88_004216 [Monilinia fructigena]|uniref:Major facilitator superfamily (MFS) profile domain-containing protein n=1 Tax=Monilinia fructigena TaxID=38457 RepID=A0A395ITF0_9HELO|nr:hypothetical protein DID88_004216 [Monilinia fructigena]